jgi:LCP family protein required for cell wall assembly
MNKKFLYVFVIVSALFVAAAAVFTFTTYKKIVVKPHKAPVTNTVVATPTPDPLRPYSILLLGYGGAGHQGSYLTDSIIVARIVPRQKQINLISIPRDLWVSIPVSESVQKTTKINAAYAIGIDDKNFPNKSIEFTGKAGGGELSKFVVSKVVGFDVDNFISLDFQGFIKTIDKLGGIPINVKTSFDDYMYPIETNINDTCGKSEDEIKSITATMSGDKLEQQFTCRYEHLHFEAGPQIMDGQTALKFIRSRHSKEDGGDFNRAARQQLLISSVKDRVLSINFIPKIIPFINTLSNNIKTDIDLDKMQEIIGKSDELSQYAIKSVALSDKNILVQSKSSDGQFILISKEGEDKWDELHDYIQSSFSSTSSSSLR